MAFPEDVLTADERVEAHLHPHGKALVRPVLVLVLAVAAVVLAWVLLPAGGPGTVGGYVVTGVALVAVLAWSVWPFLVWRGTHYLFTNERVLVQWGVVTRDRRDIPLARVNDHAMSQRFVERLFGCGTLTIESAGERGQVVLASVPGVQRVQTLLYELVEADRDANTVSDADLRDALRDTRPEAGPRPR